MGESWYLKLMGFPELRRPDGRPVKLKVRKHLALLIYLVLDAREAYPRDELADLLWPEVPDGNGRHSLSMAFSVLRGLFGSDCIRGNHAEVEFRAPSLALDLEQLERGDALGNATIPALEVEGFLRGFEIEDAPAFQHWCDRRKAQLLPLLQAAILALTDQARRSGDMQRMMALADRLLALDPLSEEGIRARMEAFAMQGDRVSALREFEAWKRQLAEELGAVPSEILEAMALRLRRRGFESVPTSAGNPVAGEPWAERRFVGRAAEFQVLFEAWESTTQLNTRHVLLSGETGIGKSTLAMRFAASAALEGATVARVQCFELEQRIPFGMIGALVTSLLDRPAVAGTAPEALAEVARIVPKVRERFPHLPAPRDTEGGAARLHFAEGTFALFDALMEEQPLVLIVDDYPRSDEASLSVLHMLLRRAGSDQIMVVLSGRPPEPDEPPQAARIRKGISYLPLRRLEIGALSEPESEDLLQALLTKAGKIPGSPERRAILQTAGGNPMALELLAQDWITHGEAALAVSLPAMRADVPGSALEAIGYDRLIERMLPALSPRTRVALYLAAILGPRLNDLEGFKIVDLTPAQTMAALSELVEQRVLRNTERGLEFINELIRARLYLKIPTAARVRLHHGVADRLLAAIACGERIPSLEVAWHCIRAKRRDEATPYLMNGARDAITHGAPDEAARALSSAIGHLKGRAKAEATLLLAETYQEMAEWRGALGCLAGLSEEHRHDQQVREMAEILEMESQRQLGVYPPDKVPGVLSEVLSRALNYRRPSARARAAFSAACLAASLRRLDLFNDVSQVLKGLDLAGLETRDAGRVLAARAMTNCHFRQNEQGREELLTAAALLDITQTMNSTFVEIQTGLGAISVAEGRYAEGATILELAHKAAARLDNSVLISQAAANLSLCYYRLGLPDESLKWAMIAWEKSKHITSGSYPRIHLATRCALAHVSLADNAAARRWLATLRDLSREAQFPWVRQAAMLFEADIAWLLGQRATALAIVEEIRTSMDQVLSIAFVGPFARWTAVSAIAEHSLQHARGQLRRWYDNLAKLDALDQAELLCGLLQVEEKVGTDDFIVRDQARSTLARLPLECSKQLRQLGLLLPNRTP